MGLAARKGQKSTTSSSRRHPTLLIICSEHEKVVWSDNHKTASAEIESFVITFYQFVDQTNLPFTACLFLFRLLNELGGIL